ncbi:MAG: hypothetical protein JGK17_14715 [Microcoleus sp. PH2017_10_PVI_O_A]|nr:MULTISPECIES: hypothetical protein [unclassified Microcoleus]MCC3406812.1 hypothetical protein [Microcoleus sp. PH2017_10_PVI_O_A]MCC3479469.1 hypothetical protein [Microcoleus sp. PH2017_12_PCY_D_A]MCC3526817.1 hypothetical protein [Microcoleus sp. PH2017_21_RUC_O_A]MCC3538992.1 hypothetical protein [Microcoleus sp. PH2017_22_RUC_O_B]
MEQPHPGTGGRHRRTQSYGQKQPYFNLSPRQALACAVWDVRSIWVHLAQGEYIRRGEA